MIQTKIRCDNKKDYMHRYDKIEVVLSEAIAAGWWEISRGTEAIAFNQPKDATLFTPNSQHACCAYCAREVMRRLVEEIIQDLPVEAPSDSEPF